METPFEFGGSRETCIGCGTVVHAGDLVTPISSDRPDRLLCVGCWWLQACELPLPGWARRARGSINLTGVFRAPRRARPPLRPS